MQITRNTILTGLLFIGIITGFVLLNYTIPLIPYLLYFSFPLNTITFWLFLCFIYSLGLTIQGVKSIPDNFLYTGLILLLIALKVTIPPSFFSVDFTTDPQWKLVFRKSIHWGYKAIIPVLIYLVWRFYLQRSKPAKITLQNKLLITAFAIALIPALFYLKTVPSFQAAYPKLKAIAGLQGEPGYWKYALTFESFYLLDFITIEILFRGLLLQVFLKSKNAKYYIIPMALVYGVIHLGKPIPECISSFFGGLLLGWLTFRTNEIYQGILIHLFIAIAMEVILSF